MKHSFQIGIVALVAFTAGIFTASDELRAYAANTIRSIDIVDGQVKTVDLGGNSVTSAKIKASEVKLSDIAPNSVDSSKVVDGSIGAADLSDSFIKTVTLHDDETGLALGWDPNTGGKMTIIAPDVILDSAVLVNLIFTTGVNEFGKQCYAGDINSGQFQLICNFQGSDPVDLRYTVINGPS
jgi:hypothetical protein